MKKFLITSFLFFAFIIGFIYVSPVAYSETCDGVNTSILSCGQGDDDTLGGVGEILKVALRIMQYLIYAIAVAALTYAGILYATAAGNSEQIKKSVAYIRNTIIGLLAFAVIRIALAWLVPGFDVSW